MKLSVEYAMDEEYSLTSCPEGWSFAKIEGGFQVSRKDRCYTVLIRDEPYTDQSDALVVFSSKIANEIISHKKVSSDDINAANSWACTVVNHHMMAFGNKTSDIVSKLTGIKDTLGPENKAVIETIDSVIKSIVD